MKDPAYTTRMVNIGRRSLTLQINTINLSEPRYVRTVHWHDFFELEFVLKGQAIHMLNGKAYPIKPGSLYLLTPADLHTIIPDPSCDDPVISVMNISFTDALVSDSSFVEIQMLPTPLIAEATGKNFDDLKYLSDFILEAAKLEGPHAKDILMHSFYTIIFMFLRLYHLQHSDRIANTGIDVNDREIDYIRNAIAYIRYNFQKPDISVSSIASAINLSPNYFGTIFKRHMKKNCLSFVKDMRMDFAKSLLQNTSLTVAEIAQKCGYTNLPYFVCDFRKTFGNPPQKYREEHHKL